MVSQAEKATAGEVQDSHDALHHRERFLVVDLEPLVNQRGRGVEHFWEEVLQTACQRSVSTSQCGTR
jgi:hypothetical protein